MAGQGLSKEQFLDHVKGAMASPGGPERQKLYFELLKCFTDADKDFDGSINPIEFDNMIEQAAAMPREHGLAPLTSQMYKTPEDRLKGRQAMFAVSFPHPLLISAFDHLP